MTGETPNVRAMQMVMDDATARERERCAKIVENFTDEFDNWRRDVAAAIRNKD